MERLSDPAALIALFNHNIALEHGAIVQYLAHAYALGEGGVGAEIINIARSEMRHLKYFADMVVEWGGTVQLARPPVALAAPDAGAMIRLGIAAEEDAIGQYAGQLERVAHAGAARVLARVLDDERLHHEQFADFEAEVVDLLACYPQPGPPTEVEVATLVNETFRHEYEAVLGYLGHYFQLPDFRARDFVFENVVWRMKAMGLLADELHERGADPALDAPFTPMTGGPGARVTQALHMEQEDAARYRELARCPVPVEVRRIFMNSMAHHGYGEGQMQLLLGLLAREPASLTVGDMVEPAGEGLD